MRSMAVSLMVCCWIGMAQADLAVTNGDFEANAAQTSNVTDWYDTVTANTNNWWETTWAGPNVSPNGTSVMGLSYMFTTTNWAYQSLGTNDANWEGIAVTYDVGSFTDAGSARDLGVTVSVYESDGTFVPADNTDVDGAAGITLLDSVSTAYPAVAVGAVIADQTITLDLRSAGSGAIFLRFENFAGTTGEPWTAIDNVEIAPVVFSFDYDSPAGNADNIPVERTASENDLVFTINDASISKVDVQFGLENDPNLTNIPAYKIVQDLAVTPGQYTIDLESELSADLEYNTTYYWKVIGYEPNTAPGATDFFPIPGPVSTFTTIPEEPEVTAVTPAYTAVDAGTVSVQLSVTGTNVIHYQWHKVGNPDVALNDGADYAGTATNTLTIYDVQLADEGYYYCYVENTAGNATSDPGRLMTKRLTSYYPLEVMNIVDGNDVTPDTIGGFDMTMTNEAASAGLPVLGTDVAAAALGTYSLVFDNADEATDPNGQFALIADDVAKYVDITIGVWVKYNGGDEWQRIYDIGSTTSNYMFLTPDAGGDAGLRFAITTGSGEQQVNAPALTVGEWTHVAVTIDGNTGRLYVDGELVDTNPAMTLNPIAVTQTRNYVGKSQWDDAEFNGLIDDLKIYNYARSTVEIGQDYLAVSGDAYVCNWEIYDMGDYDDNDNCKIDLPDFAAFAARWLEDDRIYPAP